MQKLTRSLTLAGALAFAGVLAGCGDDVTVSQPTTVTVTPASASIPVGGTVTLTAAVTGNIANKTVTWSSSDNTKATVDGSGKVTGVAIGNATIIATSAGDPTATSSALITITAKNLGVSAVEVAPNNAILKVGEFLQLTAQVSADPGVARTVTWSTSDANVATVGATDGKVTAIANGTATITAKSTVDPTVTGSMALTVRPIQPAQISIQKVTAGSTNTPVNPNNVAGQIDVTLNLDPGDQTVTKVEVLLDGQVACSQNLSVAESNQLRLAGAFENVEAVDIVCPIITNDFDATTGAVKYLNGTHQLTARATIGGNQAGNVASPSVQLIFNNTSGFIANVSNTNTAGGPASAINPTTGLKWVQGDVTLKLTAVNYTAGGATVNSVSGAFLGKTFTGVAPAAGTQVFTIVFPNSTPANPLNLIGYQTPVASAQSLPTVTASTLSSGQTGPTAVINVGAGAANLGLTPLDSTRVDNVAPTVPPFTAAPLWVNADSTFAAGKLGTATIASTTDTGVDNVSAKFYVTPEGGALTNATGSCTLTGTTEITSASQLAATIVNTAYQVRVVYMDALGNKTCADLVGTGIGADFQAPSNVTLTGVTNNSAFNNTGTAAGTNYVLASTGDNASGISATTPGFVSISRLNAAGTTTCVIGTGTACAQTLVAGTASITGAATTEGYYTLTAQMTDVAGNAGPTPAFTRLFLVDATAPSFTGNVGLNAQYAGNAPATFTNLNISDNLDLGRLFGVVDYTGAGAANISLEYPSQTIGTFGPPLEKTFTGNYTIQSLIRCINAPNTFAANATSEAVQITFTAEDQALNQATVAPVVGALGAALDNCGAVGNLPAGSAINTFNDVAPSYGAGKTQVSIAGTTTGVNSANVVLSAIADVTLDNSPEPFTRVEFYYQNASGNFVKIGQAGAGVLNQTVTTRTWTYNFTWDPDATVPVNATTNVIAIGIDAQGDAVATAGVVVNVAP